ncbi:hypothetical protein B296_00033848 [Ensete ventricosum]|uniref:Uncharacterized protein n=1 Tax=Ensete ventricosum TaxID=4639 RepID=A0A427A7J3_ENSVE|nr:hypothetical protein B296_00033848 [Ensete ventricosum]
MRRTSERPRWVPMIDLYRILTRTPKPSHLARAPPRLEIIRCSIPVVVVLFSVAAFSFAALLTHSGAWFVDMEASCRSENSGAAALRGGVPRGGDCLGRGKVSPLASSSGMAVPLVRYPDFVFWLFDC